jgi:hypothetical protein
MLLLAAPGTTRAQVLSNDPFANLPEAPTEGQRNAEEQQRVFRLVAEQPLPGPLPEGGPRLTAQGIVIAVADGWVLLPLDGAGAARPTDAPPSRDDRGGAGAWVEDARGTRRFQADPTGWLRAEKRCRRCDRGWRAAWKLRVGGIAAAAPLVVAKRVCYGSTENRVFCVRGRSGHRVWGIEVDGRATEPLVLWRGAMPAPVGSGKAPPRNAEAVLVVLEQGAELVALALDDGLKIGRLALGAERNRLVGVPVVTPEGRIVVARQGYAEADAALLFYELAAPRPEELPADEAPSEDETAPALSER